MHCNPGLSYHANRRVRIGVFTLVTRGWAVSEFLTCESKFNMTLNGERQIIGPDRSHVFDARVTNVKTLYNWPPVPQLQYVFKGLCKKLV